MSLPFMEQIRLYLGGGALNIYIFQFFDTFRCDFYCILWNIRRLFIYFFPCCHCYGISFFKRAGLTLPCGLRSNGLCLLLTVGSEIRRRYVTFIEMVSCQICFGLLGHPSTFYPGTSSVASRCRGSIPICPTTNDHFMEKCPFKRMRPNVL